MTESRCYRCKLLEYQEVPPAIKERRVSDWCYRCGAGRFDQAIRGQWEKVQRWFAWGGIVKPNKTVRAAQTGCTGYRRNIGAVYRQ